MASTANQRKAASGFSDQQKGLALSCSACRPCLVCIGILIPFLTAVVYSLQRYRLSNQPWARQFNWGDNYINFMSDPGFWNTLKISLVYAGTTVTLELLLGLGIALLLQRRSRPSTISSRSCC